MRRDLALMYVAQALRYVAPLILVPFYGRILGIGAYGQLLSSMALMQIAWIAVEWGLPSTGLRDVAAAETVEIRGQLVGEQLFARLVLAAIVTPVAVIVALSVPALSANLLVSFLCIALGVTNAFNMTWYFQSQMEFRFAAAMELVGLLISTPLILFLVNDPTQAWLIPGVLLLVSAVSFLAQLSKSFSSTPASTLKVGHPFGAIRASTLLFFDRGQNLLLGPLSILLLGVVAPAAQVAWYAIAERLVGILNAILGPLQQIFASLLSRSVAQMKQGAEAKITHGMMHRVVHYSVLIFFIISALGWIFADFLIFYIFGTGFESVVPTFRILCGATFFAGIGSTLVTTLLYPLRHDRAIAAVSSVRLMTTFSFVAVAGEIMGATGAAWGRTMSATLTLCFVLLLLKRRRLLHILVRK